MPRLALFEPLQVQAYLQVWDRLLTGCFLLITPCYQSKETSRLPGCRCLSRFCSSEDPDSAIIKFSVLFNPFQQVRATLVIRK